MLAYYGDDFTGSTDAMEALARGGVETVLFVDPPTEEMLRQYPTVRAIGIAGNSRTMSPGEMDAALPEAFHALRAHRPHIVHYKVCSTFDSSPQIGSIGRAIDTGARVFQNRFVPLVVGAPVLARYCVFGNLFARSGMEGAIYRLDRHPTMRHHPVTPMTEADLRVHLSRQTDRPVALVDVLALDRGYDAAAEQLARAIEAGGGDGCIVLFDTLTDAHLATIGRLIWESQQREQQPLFVAGSSGIEYALTKHWQTAGVVQQHVGSTEDPHSAPKEVKPVDRVVVVSGSCSPVTGRQIAWAVAHGFADVPLDTAGLMASAGADAEIAAVVGRIGSELAAGRSVVVHTSCGPDDPRIAATQYASLQQGKTAAQLGGILGSILPNVLQVSRLRRVAVAGGDTAGQVARALGVGSLEMVAPLAPGAPLCLVRSRDPLIDGIEITFKGGQVGHDDFFGTLLDGRTT